MGLPEQAQPCLVLVVDNDAQVRATLKRLIERRYRADVIEAQDGLAALDVVTTTQFAVVITDYEMPRMDGLALTTRAKAHPAARDVPFIFMSGKDDDALRAAAAAAGADSFLPKPLDFEVLYALLSARLAGR